MPEDLHITHVYFLAAPPEYTDKLALRDAHIEFEMDPIQLHEDVQEIAGEDDREKHSRILHRWQRPCAHLQ